MQGEAAPTGEDRLAAYQRLSQWLADLGRHPAEGPVLWVDPQAVPTAPLERWLLQHAGVSAATSLRLRSALRLSQEWLSAAKLAVPVALDRTSWRAISLALAKDAAISVQAAADLVWNAHLASLGAPVTAWLQALDEPWRAVTLELEQGAQELAQLRMPPDVERLGREALAKTGRRQGDRLLFLADGSSRQREMARSAAEAGMETLSMPLHLATTDISGTPTRGEELSATLRAQVRDRLPDHLFLVAADTVGEEASLIAARVRRAIGEGVDPERIVVAMALTSALPAMARALRSAGLRPAWHGAIRPSWAGQRWLAAAAGWLREPSSVDAWQGLTDSALGPAELSAPTGSRLMRRLTLGGWLSMPPASISRLLTWPERATVDQHLERLFQVYADANLIAQVEDLGPDAVSAMNRHLAMLRQLVQAAGTQVVARQRWADVLVESLPALALEDGPAGRHQVQLTTLGQAAGRPADLLWIGGLISGTLPQVAGTELPTAPGGPWQPWLEERERRQEALLDSVLAGCTGEVWASYPKRDQSGQPLTPALWVERLRQGGVAAREASQLKDADRVSSIQQLGRTLALAGARLRLSGSALDAVSSAQVRQLEDLGLRYGLRAQGGSENLSADLARLVFGAAFSVTDLQERAKCPTRHLVRALRFQEPTEGMDARAWGTALHALVARAAADDVSSWEGEVSRTLDDLALPELADGTERSFWQDRLTEVITGLAPAIRREVRSSAADESAQEIALGGDRGQGIALGLSDGSVVQIRGRIDRLDRFGDQVRVVDYKSTSAKTLRVGRWTRLLAEVDLQLLAYGLSIRRQKMRPVALEYVSLTTPWTNGETESHAPSALARVGLYAARPGLSELLGVHEGQELVRKDGTVSRRGGALSTDQMERLIDLTELRLVSLAEAARSGQSAPDPIRLGRSLACSSCPLQPICRYEGTGQRQVAEVSRSEFIAWVDR